MLIRKTNTHSVEERYDSETLQEGTLERLQELQTYMTTFKHLKSTYESTNEKAREDTPQNPATRPSWIQEQIFNNRFTRRKPTEGEMQRI